MAGTSVKGTGLGDYSHYNNIAKRKKKKRKKKIR